MRELTGDYEGKNCVVFGANSVIGAEVSKFLALNGVNLGLVDLYSYREDTLAEDMGSSGAKVIYKTVLSSSEDSFKKAAAEISGDLGGIDYLICAYYFEEERERINEDSIGIDTWDRWLNRWVLNYFLAMKAVIPHMAQRGAGRVIFVNTTTGYTGEGEGEGELTGNGSIYECASSSAITGMMTSIARDVIPKGISVNGISLDPGYRDDMERITWAIRLWLSGMCEYACAQILRLY